MTRRPAAVHLPVEEGDLLLPDLLTALEHATKLTRRSLATILARSGRLEDFRRDPQRFIELVTEAIHRAKTRALVGGIRYVRLGRGSFYARELLAREELTGHVKSMLAAKKCIHDHVPCGASGVERAFAESLEQSDAVKVYAKLPRWFTVPTPFGDYTPGWAVLVTKGGGERFFFVVETRGDPASGALPHLEAAKRACGKAHFDALRAGEAPAEYVVATSLDDVLRRL